VEKAALEEKAASEENKASVPETAVPDVEEAKRSWETEKIELIKVRDEALANLKVSIPAVPQGSHSNSP
jgi:hypothetical protein